MRDPFHVETITQHQVDAFREDMRYRLVTVVPLVEQPVRKTYVLTHEELEAWFEAYAEFGEFVVELTRIE